MTKATRTHQGMLCALLLLSIFLSTACGFSTRQPSLSIKRRTIIRRAQTLLPIEEETEITAENPLTQVNGDLPTVIQQIADERQDFNVNLGKAMDTLRKDMPEILRSAPG